MTDFPEMPRIPEEVFAMQRMLNDITNHITGAMAHQMMPPGVYERTSWEQVRFPRSKKGRIRKKWSKDQRNFGPVRRLAYTYKVESPRLSFVISNMEGV